MPGSPSESAWSAPVPALSAADSLVRRSPLEEEVTGLFDELRAPLLRYALTLGLAAADGEEIVQETFLALFQHLRQGKSRANLRGWLFRVTHNLALKKRARGTPAAAEEERESLADPAPNPEDQAMSGQKRERVQAVLRALPEQDRRCLALRAEGLRYREIAGVLEISLGAVSVSLTRSLARVARAAER